MPLFVPMNYSDNSWNTRKMPPGACSFGLKAHNDRGKHLPALTPASLETCWFGLRRHLTLH